MDLPNLSCMALGLLTIPQMPSKLERLFIQARLHVWLSTP